MELAQLGTRLDPELVDECRAQLAIDAQGVRLAPGTVQREQALGPEPLAQRVRGRKRFELGDRFLMTSARELGIDPGLERREALLLQPRLFSARELRVLEVRERRSPPQSQCLIEKAYGAGRVIVPQGFASAGGAPLELHRVELVSRDSQQIARSPRTESVGLADRPKRLP